MSGSLLQKPRQDDEFPFNRLLLSDAELVSTLLRCGCSEDTALAVLGNSGLASLLRLEESAKRGFGRARTATVLAAVELARIRIPERRLMERLDLVAGYLWMSYYHSDRGSREPLSTWMGATGSSSAAAMAHTPSESQPSEPQPQEVAR